MSKSKSWPDGTARFTDLTKPVCDAIRFAYRLERQNGNRNIPWTGYDIGERELACSCSPHEKLRRKNLSYDLNEQDRTALEVIVGIAVQLGIEQGRRMERLYTKDRQGLAVALAEAVLGKMKGSE